MVPNMPVVSRSMTRACIYFKEVPTLSFLNFSLLLYSLYYVSLRMMYNLSVREGYVYMIMMILYVFFDFHCVRFSCYLNSITYFVFKSLVSLNKKISKYN